MLVPGLWGKIPPPNDLDRYKFNKYKNFQEFNNFLENLVTSALDLFEWEGLPDTMDAVMIERCLLLYGKCLFVRYENADLSLATANSSELNMYGYPVRAFGYGFNGFNHEFSVFVPGADIGDDVTLETTSGIKADALHPEGVIVYDNDDAYPFIGFIVNAAARMSDLIRSTDVAAQNLKSPFIVYAEDLQLSTVREAFKARDENQAVIVLSKNNLNKDSFQVFPTEAQPQALIALWDQFRNVEALILETLGINSNDNIDKTERLLVDEINANNQMIGGNLEKRLRQRQLGAERYNKLFGTKISVKLRRDPVVPVSDVGRYPEDDDAGDSGPEPGSGDGRGDL